MSYRDTPTSRLLSSLKKDPRFDPMSDHGGEAPEDYFVEPLSEEERARIFDEPTDRSVGKDEYKVEAIPETPAAAIPSVAAPKPAAASKSVSVPKMTQPVLPAAVEEEPEAKEPAKEDKLPAVPSEFTREALAQAISERQGLRGAKAISEAGAGIGAAIAGLGAGAVVKPGGNFDFLEKEAGEKVSDLAAKQKQAELMESRDPNSAQSKMARDFFASVNPALKDQIQGMSHAQLKEAAPWVMKKFEKEMAADQAKAKMAESHARAAESLDIRKQMVEDRNKRQLSTLKERFGKQMNQDLAPRTSNYGQDAQILNSVARLKPLIKSSKDPNQLPAMALRELATATANLLTRGTQTAMSQIEELTPRGLKADLARLSAYTEGQPKPAYLGEWVKMFEKLADREAEAAKERINATHANIAAQYSEVKQRDPDHWNQMILSHEVDPVMFQKIGDEKADKYIDMMQKAEKARYTDPQADKAYDVARKKLKQFYALP